MSDPLTVRCRACLAAPGEACIGTTSDLPREQVHRLRPLAGTPRLVRCESCEGSGWQASGRATVVAAAVTCPVCGSAPHAPCTEGGAERRHVHVVRDRAAKAGLVSCEACDAVGWLPEPPEPEGSAPLRLPVRLGPTSLGTIIDATGAFIARAAGRELGKAMVVALNAAPRNLAPGGRPLMPDRPQDTPTDGVHVIPGEVPEGVVPSSASMATPAEERTPDVPDDLMDLARQAEDVYAATAPPGTYTHEGTRRAILTAVIPEIERQIRAQVAAEQRAAAQAIEDSRGEDLDPLATAIYDGCERDPEVPAMRDDCRNIAIAAYRHLADRITQGEPVGARLALVTADDLAEILDYIVGGDDVRVVRNETLDRAFAALKATLPRGEVQ